LKKQDCYQLGGALVEALVPLPLIVGAITTGFQPVGVIWGDVRLTLLARLSDGVRVKIFMAHTALAKFGFSSIAVVISVGFFLAHDFLPCRMQI